MTASTAATVLSSIPTVDEYSCSGSSSLHELRQKGKLTIRGGDKEERIPYEYFFANYNGPAGPCPLENADYEPNMQAGDSVLYCLRNYPAYMSLHAIAINPVYGNRETSKPGLVFSKVE